METYSITYDLNKPNQDYTKLISTLESFSYYCRPTKSQWIVATHLSATEIANILLKQIDANDYLLVSPLDLTKLRGYVPQTVASWIETFSQVTV